MKKSKEIKRWGLKSCATKALICLLFHSRTTMPLLVKREWEDWNWCDKDDPTDLSSTRICLDGDLGTVLKTYREVNDIYVTTITRHCTVILVK